MWRLNGIFIGCAHMVGNQRIATSDAVDPVALETIRMSLYYVSGIPVMRFF